MKNRIKEHRKVKAGELVPHELNPRVHDDDQRAALQALLDEIGFARSVLAYKLLAGRLNLIDGDSTSRARIKGDGLEVGMHAANRLIRSRTLPGRHQGILREGATASLGAILVRSELTQPNPK
jgi:hypothetical protein